MRNETISREEKECCLIPLEICATESDAVEYACENFCPVDEWGEYYVFTSIEKVEDDEGIYWLVTFCPQLP